MSIVRESLGSPARSGHKVIAWVRSADGSPMVRKSWPGPYASERLRREEAILHRLAGVPGVPRLLAPCDGETLQLDVGEAGYVPAGDTFTGDELLRLALGLARIVAAVHARGIVHKNINPGNVLRDPAGDPVLVDFDLATTFAEERPGFAHQSEIAGTLAYLAPEQTGRTGRPVDQRADLYALGATLYAFATGRAPFDATDPLQLIRDHLGRRPQPPRELSPGLEPAQFSDVLLRLLEKEPDRRYQSADGLAYDLEKLSRGERIRLGDRDFPSRLSPPSMLVGRDAELAELRTAFDGTLTGHGRGILVAGAPGVGKTALINEVRPMVTAAGGWFVAGKFDQYRLDRHSDAVRQALLALGRLLLAEPEEELAGLRERLSTALGANAAVMVAELPELGVLLEAEPAAEVVDDDEYASRFRLGCLAVLGTVATAERPVILVADDLQWAAGDAIRLLDDIMTDPDLRGVLLVGAYRDGDIDPAHPLAAARDRWLDGAPLLTLRNLRDIELATFLREMMRLEPVGAAALAAAIRPRTGGNPYDTVELINALRRDGVLRLGAGGWSWDAGAIRGWIGSGDVVDLVAARIDELPAGSAELVGLTGALGGDVDLELLGAASGMGTDELDARLRPALEDGLFVLDGSAVRFRHDRVQQAAYARLPEAGRPAVHRRLARALAADGRWAGMAAEQYLRAVDALDDRAECTRAAELFRSAAATLRLTDGGTALRFLTAACALVDEDRADADDRLRTGLRTDLHATLYLLGRLTEADRLYAELAMRCAPIDLVEAACVQISSLTNRGMMAEALDLGERLLARFGVTRPPGLRESLPARLAGVTAWSAAVERHPDRRPELTDPVQLGIARLIEKMGTPAFFTDRTTVAWLVLESHRRWVELGPTVFLIKGLGRLAPLMIEVTEDYRTAYAVARTVQAMAERRGYVYAMVQVNFLFAGFAQAWFEPLEDNAATARRVREDLLRSGDVQYACFAYQLELAALTECSRSLESYDEVVADALALATRTGNEVARTTYLPLRQFERAMRGLTGRADGGFDDPATGFTEEDFLAGAAPVPIGRANFHVMRALSALLLDDRATLARHSAEAMPWLLTAPGMVITATGWFVRSLGVLHELTERDTPDLRAEYARAHDWLAARAADSPGTFAHLLALVEAEHDWLAGDQQAALRGFEKALRLVSGVDRRWHEALINERAGRAQLAVGLDFTGTVTLGRARAAYQAWGATAKVATLPVADVAGPGRSGPATAPRPMSETIDLMAVLEASRLLSSETNVRRLRDRVTEVVGAMTGATGVRLLLRASAGDGWLVGTPDGDVPVDSPAGAALVPVTAVRFAGRTRGALLVGDAVSDGRFGRDPRVARFDVCSLLIAPVVAHGRVRGLLVLENTLTRDAFTADRLTAVGMIAGQLAVFLDNALLYESMERQVAERTGELEAANRRLELLSATDALTGCANRRQFGDRLTAAWAQAGRDGSALALIMLDVDHFKAYNDRYGHLGGDECLRRVAQTIRGQVRINDLAARYGGEEFAIILPATGAAHAVQVAERVRAAVAALGIPHAGASCGHVTVSAGVAACLPVEGGLAEHLIKMADAELYEAKRDGRDRVSPAPLIV